jgi:hypothetical protein
LRDILAPFRIPSGVIVASFLVLFWYRFLLIVWCVFCPLLAPNLLAGLESGSSLFRSFSGLDVRGQLDPESGKRAKKWTSGFQSG